MKKSFTHFIRLSAPGNEVSLPIYFSKGMLSDIQSLLKLKSYSKVAVLTDTNVHRHWKGLFKKVFGKDDVLITIPAGEEHKNLATVQNIWATLLQHKFDRKSILINIGGGVVCDMGAFAASTYMRGIDFVQVPTTVLAITDAAIGGKTGVNFGDLKNTIGTFAQPKAVINDSDFLSTLPKREYLSGFAEIIKHGLIGNKKFFKELSKIDIAKVGSSDLIDILYFSCGIKCDVVSYDVTEKGLRKMLNFGHTVGHAIEMASYNTNKPLLHGEAVAIGMIAEARLSLLAELISQEEFDEIEKMISKAKLPTRANKKLKSQILKKIVFDKKNEKQKIKWVLLKGIGAVVIDVEQPQKLVQQAIDYVLE
jgi:3-dehydroquinate synthase